MRVRPGGRRTSFQRLAARACSALSCPRLVSRRLPPVSSSAAVTVGDWQVAPYFTTSKLGLKLGYKPHANLKVTLEFAMLLSRLHIRSNMSIRNGAVRAGSQFLARPSRRFRLTLAADAVGFGPVLKSEALNQPGHPVGTPPPRRPIAVDEVARATRGGAPDVVVRAGRQGRSGQTRRSRVA